MKITISPSEDQSAEKFPYYSISVEYPPDDCFTAPVAAAMFFQALLSLGFDRETAQKALNDFQP
jgi:Holliday junction resolvasome RuvABC DNA-binding subunit